MPPVYLISRSLDPLFAVFIGTAAAYTRITREQTSKGVDGTESLAALKRRVGIVFGSM